MSRRRSKGLGAIRRRNRKKNKKRGFMRKLTLTADQFDTFVFPQLGGSTAETESEFEVALRLLKVMKDPSLTVDKELTDAEKQARKEGIPVYAYRKLLEDQATFLLEEDTWQLLKTRIGAHKTRVPLLAAEDFAGALKAIEDAPETKVEVVEETPTPQTSEQAPVEAAPEQAPAEAEG